MVSNHENSSDEIESNQSIYEQILAFFHPIINFIVLIN
jgi:hypothetical protein